MASSNPAETYERYMVPPLFAPSARSLVDAAGPQPGQRVLDVGCGTGVVAREVARRLGASGTVVGIDASPGMLDVARAESGRAGLAIDWHEGRAESLPFPDGAFDLALCQFALMFFDDRAAALAQMRRALAPGGRVAIHVFQDIGRHPFYQALDRAIERQLGASGVGAIFSLGDTGVLRGLLHATGFTGIEIDARSVTARFPDPDRFLAGEIDVDTAAIPAMQSLDGSARAALVSAIQSEMKSPLAEVTQGERVVLPFHTHIARAIRPGGS